MHGPGLIFLFFYFLFTQTAYFNAQPRGVHQWAQADRYAVAERFLESRSFFNPATYSLISDDGAVGLEFPALQFISSNIAKFLNIKDYLPLIYRFLNWLILFGGLYLFCSFVFRNFAIFQRLLLMLLLFSSPLLLFYAYNFLPDATAFGLLLWALYLYEKDPRRYGAAILIICALAALIKTLSGIFFIAFMLLFLYRAWKNKAYKPLVLQLSLFMVSLGLIVCYDYFMIAKRNEALWSTLFLSQVRPVHNIREFGMVLQGMWRWKFEYLNWMQWLIALTAMAGLLYHFRKLNREKLYFVLILGLGLVAVLLLFGTQFIYHDYYALSTFMPLGIYVMSKGVLHLRRYVKPLFLTILLSVTAIISFSLGSNRHFSRMSEDFHFEKEYHRSEFRWLEGLDQSLDTIMQKEDILFVVYETEPNLVLVYAKRKGIVFNREEMGREESNFYYWLERRQARYVLCRNKNRDQFELKHHNFTVKCDIVFNGEDYLMYRIKNGH